MFLNIFIIVTMTGLALASVPDAQENSENGACSCKKLVLNNIERYQKAYKCHCAGPDDTAANFKGLVKNCFTKCGKFGYEYEWCYIDFFGAWDYCDSVKDIDISTSRCICEQPNHTSRSGKPCLITCAGYKASVEWCFVDENGTKEDCSSYH